MAESIFSRKIKGGFVDVKETKDGKPYLQITKSKKVEGEWQNERIMIWQDDVPEFFTALKEASPHLKGE